jgi:hypothetical protein
MLATQTELNPRDGSAGAITHRAGANRTILSRLVVHFVLAFDLPLRSLKRTFLMCFSALLNTLSRILRMPYELKKHEGQIRAQ